MGTLENFIIATQSAQTSQQVAALLAEAVLDDGYENLAVVTMAPHRLHREPWRQVPPHFAECYESKRWHVIDPILQRARLSALPFSWIDLETETALSPAQIRMLAEMRELGIQSGLTVPFHGPRGACDVISVSKRSGKPTQPMRHPIVAAVMATAWQRHLELTDIGARGEFPLAKLTAREFECLDWLKSGKTSSEAALLMGISRKTVEFHVGNLFRKLGANDRVSAVVKAIRLGIVA